MSTTKTFTNIKAGKRHQIDATARGYYDFRTTVVPQPNKSLSYDMKVYDGLNYAVDLSKNSVRPGEINFDDTVLPYIENNTLTKTNYCFGNSGTNYDLPVYNKEYTNIEMNGNPTIIDGMVSNFSSENYLKFLRNKFTNNNELIFKFKLNTIKTCAIFHCEFFLSVEISGTSLICYNWQQSTAQTILDSVETNKWYWVKVEITDLATRKYSISTDGVTYIEKLSTIDTSAVLTYQSYNYMYIGNSSFNTSNNAVNGSIDLNESKIVIGENTINLGDYSLQKQYTGYTTYGNAKVNNLVCSGFDSSSKVILSNAKFNTSEPIYISFAMGPDVSSRQKIFDTDDKLSFRIENGYFWYYKNENHTWIQWKSINANTGYKIKVVINSSNNYSLGLTPINEDAYDYIDVTDTLNLTNGPVGIGNNLGGAYNQPFQGTIDISEIPGAYEVKTESKPGIFYNYEDAGQSAELNCFSKSNEFVVLSPDENIIDHTYLGKVNIPEHKISWNEPSTPDEPSVNPSTLKFGDRIDNKATVVGEYSSNDGKKYVFAVLDAQYRGVNIAWSTELYDTNTGLPDYSSAPTSQNLESATYNTDYILNNYSDKAIEAFTFCRNVGSILIGEKQLNPQLPNAYELQQIFNMRTELDALDPTAEANSTKKLSNWGFGSNYSYVWSSNENDVHGSWVLGSDDSWGDIGEFKHSTCGVVPILEIELS